MIDILIPTKDRRNKLPLTLHSIYAQETNEDIRIVLRDEGEVSAFEDREVRQMWDLLSSRFETVYMRDKESIGLVRSRKFLLDKAIGEYILWLDDDILLPSHAIKEFMRVAKRDTQFGFVIPVILDVDNAREHDDYEFNPVSIEEHKKLGSSKNYVPCEEGYVERIFRGNGGCQFVRTKAVREVVKYDFDDITTGEGEDMIASLLLADKFICYIDTNVTIHHLVDRGHQWSWAKVAGSLVKEYLKDRVSDETLEKSGLETTGYKVVK